MYNLKNKQNGNNYFNRYDRLLFRWWLDEEKVKIAFFKRFLCKGGQTIHSHLKTQQKALYEQITIKIQSYKIQEQ